MSRPDLGTGGGKAELRGGVSLSQVQLAHELASRLDGTMRALRLACRDLEDQNGGESADLKVIRHRLATAEAALGDMASMLARTRLVDAVASEEEGGRSLGEEIALASGLLEDRMHASGVRLRCRLSRSAAQMPAGALGVVIFNLLRNALASIESSKVGGVITVQGEMESDRLMMTIEDDGPGWPGGEPPVLDRAPHAGGHGIGLPLCHDIMKSAGGTLQLAQRASGRGARVVLECRVPVA